MPPVTPNTIPAAYQKFGATRGFHPKPFHRLGWIIKSMGGRGKSTFLSSIEGCLHIDMEGGAHSVVNSQAVRVPDTETALTPALFQAVYNQLVEDGKRAAGDVDKLPFAVVAIDPIDGLFNLLANEFCGGKNRAKEQYESVGEYGTEGAGYGVVYARMMGLLTELKSYGYALVLACHEREKDIHVTVGGKQETRTVIRPALGESLAKQLENQADNNAVLRTFERKVILPGEKIELPGGRTATRPGVETTVRDHVMQVECSPQYDAKRRLYLFKGNITLPLQGGWKAVKEVYDAKVLEMSKLLESGGPIPAEVLQDA